mmetsp:Transcript_60114/g.95457  ORF Transcript_60114/g.95457 Transcript_60114/m.95457 type:complete len:499 (+) Transcript_60114:21-1517(+)
MPALEVKLNSAAINEATYNAKGPSFITDVTKQLAEIMEKPERYILVSVMRALVAMEADVDKPTAFCTLQYLGPLKGDAGQLATNKRISQCIATNLKTHFNIDADRYYLVINEPQRINWGFAAGIPFYKASAAEEEQEQKVQLFSAKGYEKQTYKQLVTVIDDNKRNTTKIPMLALGTWLSEQGKVAAAVEFALKLGYKHIDCAAAYGNEEEVGEGLANAFKAGVKREDVFVTSKLWNTKHDPKDVVPALKRSLDHLGLDYVDLYLIHWPLTLRAGAEDFPKLANGMPDFGEIVPHEETWRGMEECVKLGLAKHIGLSNFNVAQIDNVLKHCKIKPTVVQCEGHPYLQQNKLRKFCEERSILLQAYSTLGNPGRPKSWDFSLKPVMEDEQVRKIATECGVSAAAVCMRFQLDRGVCCLTKSSRPARIKSNFEEAWSFKLDEDQLERLKKLDQNCRFCVPTIENEQGKRVLRDVDHPYWPWKDTMYNQPFENPDDDIYVL